jgi:hypothetical protein
MGIGWKGSGYFKAGSIIHAFPSKPYKPRRVSVRLASLWAQFKPLSLTTRLRALAIPSCLVVQLLQVLNLCYKSAEIISSGIKRSDSHSSSHELKITWRYTSISPRLNCEKVIKHRKYFSFWRSCMGLWIFSWGRVRGHKDLLSKWL